MLICGSGGNTCSVFKYYCHIKLSVFRFCSHICFFYILFDMYTVVSNFFWNDDVIYVFFTFYCIFKCNLIFLISFCFLFFFRFSFPSVFYYFSWTGEKRGRRKFFPFYFLIFYFKFFVCVLHIGELRNQFETLLHRFQVTVCYFNCIFLSLSMYAFCNFEYDA